MPQTLVTFLLVQKSNQKKDTPESFQAAELQLLNCFILLLEILNLITHSKISGE
jgi:hypothetical protein